MSDSSDSSDGSAVATPETLGRRLYLRWSAVDRRWKATVIGTTVLAAVLAQP